MARASKKARERAKGKSRRAAKGAAASGNSIVEEAGRAFDRVTLVLTLVGVCVFAIFTGYLVGQYAIRMVASPLIVTERAENPGTRVIDDEAPPQAGGAQRASGASTAAPAASTASSTSAPAASTSGGQVPAASTARTPAPAASTAPAPVASTAGTPAPAASTPAASSSSASTSSSTRTIYRVQVGRFSTRAQASAQAEALKTGDPAVPDAWVLFDEAAGVYRVQAGAFSSEQRAREFVSQLAAQGYDAYIAQ